MLLLIALLVSAVSFPIIYVHNDDRNDLPNEEFFFGVSFGGNTTSQAKLLIDKVKGYTNFFLINNWDISINETALTEISQYAVDADMSIMVYYDFISYMGYPWLQSWLDTAKKTWGNKFLGIYLYDEPGGKQIDTGLFDELHDREDIFENASTYSEAADVFLTQLPMGFSFHYLQNMNITKFVSDYALYWFDYLAGYDTIFVELGWNHSTPHHIGLCRGAATAQRKDWGAIIVWKNKDPPTFKSGNEMLQDFLTAYEAGAKYVIVFNFPKNPETNPYGILKEEHFKAMRQFWTHLHHYPEEHGKTEGQVAFVLPKDYGWGMRRPDDLMWGLWPADDLSPVIWKNMNKPIEKYGLHLDIVYEDARFNFEKYSKVYFWNTTVN